jgi:hypothetical protein
VDDTLVVDPLAALPVDLVEPDVLTTGGGIEANGHADKTETDRPTPDRLRHRTFDYRAA